MTTYAEILISVHNDLKGKPEQYNCTWQGPKDGVVEISTFFVDEGGGVVKIAKKPVEIGDVIQVGPFRLKVFEITQFGTIKTVLISSPIGMARAYLYRSTRWLDLVYRRLIITAAVWNLAHYHPSQIPSWEDLHIAKKLRRK